MDQGFSLAFLHEKIGYCLSHFTWAFLYLHSQTHLFLEGSDKQWRARISLEKMSVVFCDKAAAGHRMMGEL